MESGAVFVFVCRCNYNVRLDEVILECGPQSNVIVILTRRGGVTQSQTHKRTPDTQREKGCDNGCDWGSTSQKNQGLPETPEAEERQGAESPLEATEGTNIAHTWISEF